MAKKARTDLPQLIIYSGFSRSGKTSTVNPALESLGYSVISTSGALHKFTTLLLEKLFNLKKGSIDTSEKGTVDWVFSGVFEGSASSRTFKMVRNLLITIAEECLVPIFGREVFSLYALKEIHKSFDTGENVALESIGGIEFEVLMSYMEVSIQREMVLLNIRRDTEDPEADYRELLPEGISIQNNGSREEFQETLEIILKGEQAKKDIFG